MEAALVSPFNLDDYEPVEERLRAFWKDHPMGRISTEMIHVGADGYIVKASIWRGHENLKPGGSLPLADIPPGATGYAQEAVTERGVNSTSALENCETSAIGRALANLGYAAKGKRPSREEMTKASSSPARTVTPEPPVSGRDGDKRGVGAGVDGEDAPPDPQPKPLSDAQRWMEEFHPGKPHKLAQSETVPALKFCTQGNGKCPYAVEVTNA
jgi:hypothetical protein